MQSGRSLQERRLCDDAFSQELQALLIVMLKTSFENDVDLSLVLDELEVPPDAVEHIVMSALRRLGAFFSFVDVCKQGRDPRSTAPASDEVLEILARELARVPAWRSDCGKIRMDFELLTARLLGAGIFIEGLAIGASAQ